MKLPEPKNQNEIRLQANVNTRAQRLFADGYTLNRIDEDTLHITNEEGTRYDVSTLFLTCTCPFHKQHEYCKHTLGWEKLEKEQEAYHAHLCEGYDPNEADAEGYDSTNYGGILW